MSDQTPKPVPEAAETTKRDRIWELDAFRGICIICVVVVHLIFDLQYFAGMNINTPRWFDFIQVNGGVLFIVLSGICVTLGHRFLKRGLIVFGAGMLITLVTIVMYKIGVADKDIIIYFGVLHLLGVCMMLYGLIQKLPTWLLVVIENIIIIAGYWLANTGIHTKGGNFRDILIIFGITPPAFVTSDYFPLLPFLGWFILGVILGRTLYVKQQTLFPKFPYRSWPVRAISFIGRHSIWIYLLHQPLISGILALAEALSKK